MIINTVEEPSADLDQARSLYPQVSDIIGNQSRSDFEGVPMEIVLAVCTRENKVHGYATAYLNGLCLPQIEPEYQVYFDAFAKWADLNINRPLHSEGRLYDDENRFTGEFDLVVELKDSKQIALIDIKTSANVSKSWPIQLAAYKHLFELNRYKIDKVLNIHLKRTKSTVKTIEMVHTNLNPFWEIFKSALVCYDYFYRKEKKEI